MIEVLKDINLFAGLSVILVTLAPLHSSPHWTIRMWDFPRLQIFCIAVVLSGFAALNAQYFLLLGLVPSAAYQWWWIHPYTPLGKIEIQTATYDPKTDITLLFANVEMTNPDRKRIGEVISDLNPDAVLLLETDQEWLDDLNPVLEQFENVFTEPRDNYYGMAFATNLHVRSVEFVYITTDNTPTLLAELETGFGDAFRVIGLHPKPPVPGEDTTARDDQLTYAARFGKVEDMDLVVMGDFNDVVWSKQSRYFRLVGQYLDPRYGRGFISSFHAKYPFLRFPIDHFFVTEGVVVSEFRRGPAIGSDHFPMIARVRFDRKLAKSLNSPSPKNSEEEDARLNGMVERHRNLLEAQATNTEKPH